jgi:hypothetical protein
MPKLSRNEYDLGRCMAWFIRRLQAALEAPLTAADGSIARLLVERTKQAREQTEKMRRSNLQARGEVVLAEDVATQVQKAIAALGRVLEPVANRATTDVSVQAKIQDELRLARDRFAENLSSLAGKR